MHKFNFITGLLLALLLIGQRVPQVTAQITNPAIGELGGNNDVGNYSPSEGAIEDASSGQTVLTQFVRLWNNAITVGGILVIGYFLWGAIEWILSEGDKSKLEKARQKMMNAAIGMIILVSSFVIIGFVSSLLFGEKLDLLNLKFFTPGSASE